jgi:hypothetical protein
MTVQTSARICVYPADGFLPSADTVKTASVRARVLADEGPHGPTLARTYMGPRGRRFRGAEFFRVSTIKGGALLLFLHFQPILVE